MCDTTAEEGSNLPPELEVIKDIPCYRVILKAILRYQIQQLLTQLSEYTEEESIILSACLSDQTFSYLGTRTGRTYLEEHEDLKTSFLNFCMQKQKGNEPSDTPDSSPSVTSDPPRLESLNVHRKAGSTSVNQAFVATQDTSAAQSLTTPSSSSSQLQPLRPIHHVPNAQVMRVVIKGSNCGGQAYVLAKQTATASYTPSSASSQQQQQPQGPTIHLPSTAAVSRLIQVQATNTSMSPAVRMQYLPSNVAEGVRTKPYTVPSAQTRLTRRRLAEYLSRSQIKQSANPESSLNQAKNSVFSSTNNETGFRILSVHSAQKETPTNSESSLYQAENSDFSSTNNETGFRILSVHSAQKETPTNSESSLYQAENSGFSNTNNDTGFRILSVHSAQKEAFTNLEASLYQAENSGFSNTNNETSFKILSVQGAQKETQQTLSSSEPEVKIKEEVMEPSLSASEPEVKVEVGDTEQITMSEPELDSFQSRVPSSIPAGSTALIHLETTGSQYLHETSRRDKRFSVETKSTAESSTAVRNSAGSLTVSRNSAGSLTATQDSTRSSTAIQNSTEISVATQNSTESLTATQNSTGSLTATQSSAGISTATHDSAESSTATQNSADSSAATQNSAGSSTATQNSADSSAATQNSAGSSTATQNSADSSAATQDFAGNQDSEVLGSCASFDGSSENDKQLPRANNLQLHTQGADNQQLQEVDDELLPEADNRWLLEAGNQRQQSPSPGAEVVSTSAGLEDMIIKMEESEHDGNEIDMEAEPESPDEDDVNMEPSTPETVEQEEKQDKKEPGQEEEGQCVDKEGMKRKKKDGGDKRKKEKKKHQDGYGSDEEKQKKKMKDKSMIDLGTPRDRPRPGPETSGDIAKKIGLTNIELAYTEDDFAALTNYKLFREHVQPLLAQHNPQVAPAYLITLLVAKWWEFAHTAGQYKKSKAGLSSPTKGKEFSPLDRKTPPSSVSQTTRSSLPTIGHVSSTISSASLSKKSTALSKRPTTLTKRSASLTSSTNRSGLPTKRSAMATKRSTVVTNRSAIATKRSVFTTKRSGLLTRSTKMSTIATKRSVLSTKRSVLPAGRFRSTASTKRTREDSSVITSLKKAKRKGRKLEEGKTQARDSSSTEGLVGDNYSTGGLKERAELLKLVEFETNPFKAVKKLLNILFTFEDLLNHSISGKNPNSRTKPKPKFDSIRYNLFASIIKEKFPSLECKDITGKVHAVQKNAQRQQMKQ